MFELVELSLPGAYEVRPKVVDDDRGRFVKTFHRGEFERLGLETSFAEEYYSTSRVGVIRGMHFQTPPSSHVKLVYCVRGAVIDVLLDLRLGSPTYGSTASLTLSAADGNYVYIPEGIAHGFRVTEGDATLIYKVSTVYNAASDSGIHWNSFGFDWGVAEPILSSRDSRMVALTKFVSPFVYET